MQSRDPNSGKAWGKVALICVILTFVHSLPASLHSAQAAQFQTDGLHFRIAAYNVSFFSEASAREIGQMLQRYDLDLIGLTEVPRHPATSELAAAAGTNHFVDGTISSGQSPNKLKSILSRTPLGSVSEIDLSASRGGFVGGGESATHAVTEIGGLTLSIYTLHISDGVLEPMQKLLSDPGFLSDDADGILVIGDFNAKLTDPQMQLLGSHGFRAASDELGIDVSQLKTYDLLPGRGPNGEDRDEGVIDHLMFKGVGLHAVGGGIVAAVTAAGNPMSDHAMIWAEFTFSPVPEPVFRQLLPSAFFALAACAANLSHQAVTAW